MVYETSSGGVVVSIKNQIPVVLLLKDKNGQWTFPKGLIEKGEDPKVCAMREIREETGIKKLQLLYPLTPIEYFYKWEGKLIKKKVYYYIFTNEGSEKVKPQIKEGIMFVKWYPIDTALKVIGYRKTNIPLLKETTQKLKIQ